MGIPRSVNKLTVREYIVYSQIANRKYDYVVDKQIALLSHYTKISEEVFGLMSENELESWKKKIRPLINSTPSLRKKRAIWIKGVRYLSCKNEKYFDANQWTALKSYEENQDANTHKILSLFYVKTPLFKKYKFKDTEASEVAEALLDAKLKDVYGMFFFYSHRFEVLRLISQVYSEQATQTIKSHLNEIYQELKSLGVNTDGSLSSMTSQMEAVLNETKS